MYVGIWRQERPLDLDLPGVEKVYLQHERQLRQRVWDVLLVTQPIPPGLSCACRVLLLEEDRAGASAGQIRAGRVVSFGMSSKSTLTLAAMEEQKVLCIQREFATVSGRMVEIQELPLPQGTLPRAPEELLAAAALALFLDL